MRLTTIYSHCIILYDNHLYLTRPETKPSDLLKRKALFWASQHQLAAIAPRSGLTTLTLVRE